MVMIDELITCDKDEALTKFRIPDDSLFSEHGLFTETGLLENIAQTAAARIGWLIQQHLHKDESKIPIGVIGAVKDFKLFFLPEVRSELTTQLMVSHEIMNAVIVKGSVKANGKTAAECEMKIFLIN